MVHGQCVGDHESLTQGLNVGSLNHHMNATSTWPLPCHQCHQYNLRAFITYQISFCAVLHFLLHLCAYLCDWSLISFLICCYALLKVLKICDVPVTWIQEWVSPHNCVTAFTFIFLIIVWVHAWCFQCGMAISFACNGLNGCVDYNIFLIVVITLLIVKFSDDFPWFYFL